MSIWLWKSEVVGPVHFSNSNTMDSGLSPQDQLLIWNMLPLTPQQRAIVLAAITEDKAEESAVFSIPQLHASPSEIYISDVGDQKTQIEN